MMTDTIYALHDFSYPRHVTGCNGSEFVNFVMEDLNHPEYDFPHEFYADRSPEYWTGCTLAYFQWRQNLPFRTILQKIPVQRILGLYPLGHEQDVRNIADILSDML